MNTMMSYFNGFKEPAYIFKINVRNNDKNYILSNVLKIYKNIKINLSPKSNKIFRNPEE
jgi:hypothetical protein